jgi:hypothetical protein
MNKDRLAKIAEWLEGGAKHKKLIFDMKSGVRYRYIGDLEKVDFKKLNACKTVCCIAGAATQFFNDPKQLLKDELERNGDSFMDDFEIEWDKIYNHAKELLDLTYGQADALFKPHGYFGGRLDDYSDPAWAARTIRNFIKTGVVKWVRPEDEE